MMLYYNHTQSQRQLRSQLQDLCKLQLLIITTLRIARVIVVPWFYILSTGALRGQQESAANKESQMKEKRKRNEEVAKLKAKQRAEVIIFSRGSTVTGNHRWTIHGHAIRYHLTMFLKFLYTCRYMHWMKSWDNLNKKSSENSFQEEYRSRITCSYCFKRLTQSKSFL